MARDVVESVIAVKPFHPPFYVESFLRKYPEVEEAIRAAGAYVVVFRVRDERGRERTAESVARRTREALDAAERALPDRPGVPIFVAYGPYFEMAVAEESPLLIGLRSSVGVLAGFVDVGCGGARFHAPDGRGGGWKEARDLVMELLATLRGVARES